MGNHAVSQELIDLGERIRKQRQLIRMSQEVLAEQAGVSINTISRIEGGQSAMSVEIFRRIVLALGMDANELLGAEIRKGEKAESFRLSHQIRGLEKEDQEVVHQMLGALVDALQERKKK